MRRVSSKENLRKAALSSRSRQQAQWSGVSSRKRLASSRRSSGKGRIDKGKERKVDPESVEAKYWRARMQVFIASER